MKTKEVLLSEVRKLRSELDKADQQEFRCLAIPKHRDMVGKAFVYRRNCFSCPTKPSDYWDCFRLVRDMQVAKGEAYLHLIFEEISIDARGRSTLSIGSDIVSGLKEGFGGGWVPCKVSEYRSQKAKVLREMQRLTAIKAACHRKD